jgi:Tfp pilus assembly protein PilX
MMTQGRQQGSVLIYTMLTMSVMLAIGLTLSSLFVGKLRSAAAARAATTALYAADSAVELCLYEARNGVNEPPLVMANGATVQIEELVSGLDITDDCSALGSSFSFRATGKSRSASRTLEISQ